MIDDTLVVCPQCHQSDKTYKVSLLYLEGIERINHRATANQPEISGLVEDLLPGENQPQVEKQVVARLVKTLAPPQGENKVTRRVHPDSMVVFFGLFLLVILYQVTVNRSPQSPILAVIFTGGLLAYLLARKTIVQRYTSRIKQDQDENARIERAIGTWMRLYFCGRDQCVFNPDTQQSTSAEDMHSLFD